MAVSTTTNYAMTARDVIDYALGKLGVLAGGNAPTAEDIAHTLISLNLMLKSWQLNGPNLWRKTRGSLTLTDGTASYSLPLAHRVISCRFRQNGRDLPMELMTGEDYDDMVLKTSTGIPTQYYFDAQQDAAQSMLYIWPVLATAAGETIEYTYQRRFFDVATLDDTIDVPQEYLSLVGYALAYDVAADFQVSPATVEKPLARLMTNAMAADREPAYRFEPDMRR